MTLKVKQYTGLWWVPDNPDNRIYGKLSYKCGEYPILSLDGAFVDKREESKFYEIILGTVDGRNITLVNCAPLSISFTYTGSGDYARSKFQVLMFCVGHHFAKKNELQFTAVSVKYSHLKKWLGPNIFHFSDRKETKTELILNIKKPLEIEIKLSTFTLKIKGIWEGVSGLYHDSCKRDAVVSIYSEKTNLGKLFDIIYAVRNFLCLAIGEEISILNINADEIHGKIEIVAPNFIREKSSEDRISFYPLPIEFNLISKNIEFYLRNWFSFIEKYEPVYQLFFGAMDEKAYPINEFLNLSQAIEAYHSRKYENRLFSDQFLKIIDQFTQFSEIIAVLPLPKRSKSAFRKKFEFMNRKSLRMRTKDLFKEYSEIFHIFITDEKDFISTFVESRNFYTHYDLEVKKPIESTKIPFLIENLRLILMTILLKEMGFEQKQIERIIHLYCRTRIREIYKLF